MPSDRRSPSAGSGHSSRGNTSMGPDGGEAGRRLAAEDEYIKRELMETTSFCNAFWGSNDAGYEVIQARVKGAQRTMEDLKAMYKERADIEAEYSKRLAKLAKQALGREETGALRAALDTVKFELDSTARTHADLANMIKKDLEGNVVDFQSKALPARKNSQSSIEKLHKNKQTQEQYVNKSRDKYEQDCIKINGYTAQSSLVQGKDLDKVAYKLDKAQATVAQNDRDYQNFVRALKDTTIKWNAEWKSYLDQCQDGEEERLDFMKSNLWNFANAVSAVCVADDESCERVRVALENVETPRDIQLFIQYCGTGSMIPAPPEYINYAKGQPPPPRPTYHQAKFQRNTTRPIQLPISQPPPAQQQPPPVAKSPALPTQNLLNVAPSPTAAPASYRGPPSPAGGQNGGDPAAQPGSPFKPPPGAVALPGMSPGQQAANLPPVANQQEQGQSSAMPTQEKRMSARNFLARTSSLSQGKHKPPTGTPAPLRQSSSKPSIPPSDSAGSGVTDDGADEEDPIAKALASLRMRPGGKSPGPHSPGPGTMMMQEAPHVPPPAQNYGQNFGQQQPSQMTPQHSTQSPSVPHGIPGRARSPSAAFMQAPARSTSPMPVEDVVGQYGQSFPGERKSLSRQNSSASRMSMRPSQSTPSGPLRSPSKNDPGFAGVGARGRSPSPQPFAGRPQQQQQPSQASNNPTEEARRRPSMVPPPRSTTPLGISLDATGSVTHDQMADEYVRHSGSVPPVQQPPPPSGGYAAPPQQQHQQQPQRPSSVAPSMQAPPPQQQQQQPHGSYHQQISHQSTPSMHSQFGGPPSQAPVQRPPSVQGHYSYQGSISQAHQPYASQHAAQPSTVQQAAYGQPPPPQQQPSTDPRAYGGFVSPAPYQQPPPPQQQQQPPPPAASQSLPAHLAQQQYGRASPAPQQQYHQQPAYYGQHPPPPASETPASAYMHQYQQQQNGHAQQPSVQQQPPPSQHFQQQSQWNAAGRSASPGPVQQPVPNGQPHPPTGQFSDSGKPILFYVKALYDYQATMEEEFSFTAGDIIAVTHTEADGWWQGELLDEARRRPGSNTFPSNFVVLLM